MLTVKNLKKRIDHGATHLSILDGADFELGQGEAVALIGPSGSGKTTLLQILGLLDAATSGSYKLDGQECHGLKSSQWTALRRRYIGFVYQFHYLLDEFNALENVMMPLLIQEHSTAHARQRALELLEKLGLSQRLNHYPVQLSGGEQQRVAIARALAAKPKLLLADEPTGNLDRGNARKVFAGLLQTAREEGVGALIATHDLELAMMLDRQVYLYDGALHDTPPASAG